MRSPTKLLRLKCSILPTSPPALLSESGLFNCSSTCQNVRRILREAEKKKSPSACFKDLNFLLFVRRKKDMYSRNNPHAIEEYPSVRVTWLKSGDVRGINEAIPIAKPKTNRIIPINIFVSPL